MIRLKECVKEYQVNETNVARNAEERIADSKAYRSAFLDTPRRRSSIFIGRYI